MKRLAGAVAVAGLVGLLLACAGDGEETPPEHAATVRTARAESGTIIDWIRLYGRIVPPPDGDATLAPRVAGVLTAVPVREGQAVAAGAVVARLDSGPLDDELRAAEAAERRARTEAAFRRNIAVRSAALVEKGVSSRQEAEGDEAAAASAAEDLAQASSALASARRRSDWATLRAPFDGVVVRVLRRPGDTIDGTPATPVVQISAAKGEQVAADATAESLVRIRPDQPAEVSARGAAAPALRAHVLRVARAVETATGSGVVHLAFDDDATDLPLGLGVEVRIAAGQHEGIIIVPSRAIRRGEDGALEVVVVEQGKAVVRTVTTGIADGDRIEVVSGLSPGESVVVEDPVGLADGQDLQERP